MQKKMRMPEVLEVPTSTSKGVVMSKDLDLDLEEQEQEQEQEQEKERRRPRLSENNIYFFKVDQTKVKSIADWTSKDEKVNPLAHVASSAKKDLRYKDTIEEKEVLIEIDGKPTKVIKQENIPGGPVENFRVFRVTKDATYDDNGVMKAGQPVGFVLAGSSMQAAEFLCRELGYDIDLHFKQKRKGRVATKVETSLLNYGKLLATMIFNEADFKKVNLQKGFKKDADPNLVKQWNNEFTEGSPQGHYLDHNTGIWKEANT